MSTSSMSNDINEVTNAENTHKTVHWLQSTLGEVRSEIADLSRSVNVSQQLQRQQEAANQLQLTRSDVAAVQSAVAEAAAHRAQLNQSLQQVQDQLQRTDQQQHAAAAQLQRLENNVSNFQCLMLISLSSHLSLSYYVIMLSYYHMRILYIDK